MFCPRCASSQSDDVKFCTVCGANLQAVRQVVDTRDTGKKFDWADTWVADMFRNPQAAELHKLEMERRLGITPEVKRLNEIKAGVITSSVGIGLAIFLYVFMRGISGNVDPDAAAIITRIWVVGVIPFLVGLALIVNGMVVSKKLVAVAKSEQDKLDGAGPPSLRAANTNEFISSPFSVTEQTTKHLGVPEPKSDGR